MKDVLNGLNSFFRILFVEELKFKFKMETVEEQVRGDIKKEMKKGEAGLEEKRK